MAEITRPCWQCELCGHVWIKDPNKPDPPPQCSKCKKRNWNTPPDSTLAGVPVVVHPLAPVSGVTLMPPAAPVFTNVKAAEIPARRPGSTPLVYRGGNIKTAPRCPRCGRPLKQWGTNMLRCDQCEANWTPEQAGVSGAAR